jgi:threonine aldolase
MSFCTLSSIFVPMKYKFLNDYSEGCHPAILERLLETNLVQQSGYGNDDFTESAIRKIKAACENEALDVHFVAGGTLANLLVISSFLKPYESVISAESGHINTHEAGAIEATGHKIEYVKTNDGKLTVAGIAKLLMKFPKYHTVKPRMVYISNTTELGTIYSEGELEDIYNYCQANGLLLFIDGARLPMALVTKEKSLTLSKICRLCDVFYIGGTKSGALMGEAIVICNPDLQEDFKYNVKQRGAMMAKGRALGVQFDVLFTDNLIFTLADFANSQAEKIANAFRDLGYLFLCTPQSNQVFPIVNFKVSKGLSEKFDFFEWEYLDEDHVALRIVTSWTTSEAAVEEFITLLKSFGKREIDDFLENV